MSKAETITGRITFHPLVQVAHTVVGHIHDYPSLIILSMTCQGFWNAVHDTPVRLARLFDELEANPEYDLDRYGICHINKHKSDRSCVEPIHHFAYGRLYSRKWLPCCWCRTIKHENQFMAFGEDWDNAFEWGWPERRRCIHCVMLTLQSMLEPEPTEFYMENWVEDERYKSIYPLRGISKAYLVDMPKANGGYCLECFHCRCAEWIKEKPSRQQQIKKGCRACFIASRNAARILPKKFFAEG